MVRNLLACALCLAATAASAQTPQPFPRPNTQKPAQPPPTPPAPAPQAPATQAPPPQAPAPTQAPKALQAPQAPTQAPTQAPASAPNESDLGAPLYPSAVYLTSFDAGRGQRFYIYGATVPYADLVGYYKTVLKQKGDELFDAPPTHQFETARFRDESMAFAPSVTIKDYTYGGSAGYPNPKKGATPERYPTIIQIVPAPR